MTNMKAMDLLAEVVATRELEREAYDLHCRIEEFINQPAAGEPEQQAATNADDLPTKKYPLGALDFDAPVAAVEPLTGKRLYGMYTGPSEYQHDKWRVVTDQHADWNRLADRLNVMMAAPPTCAHRDEHKDN